MSTPRLVKRVPSARALGRALLRRHMLRFHKIGKDGSAKCDAHAVATDNGVWGVVFDMSPRHKGLLDRAEDLGVGYLEKKVRLLSPTGETLHAVTYYAIRTDASLRPFHWYKEHVLRGAREHALPPDYIARIEAVPSLDDPEPGRQEAELSIYRTA